MISRVGSTLRHAEESGDAAAIAVANQALVDAKRSADEQKQEAEEALAKAATMEAKVQVEKEEAQAFSEEKEAQDAEMAVTKAEALLSQSQQLQALLPQSSEGNSSLSCAQENLDIAKVTAVRARNEAELGQAEAEQARSELKAVEAAARAVRENLDHQTAEQMVKNAESALEDALIQQDKDIVAKARVDVEAAKAAAEQELGQAQVASAVAAVAAAEATADKAAAHALNQKMQARAAENLLLELQEQLTDSKNVGGKGMTWKAAKNLTNARSAAIKNKLTATTAAAVAAEKEALAELEAEAAQAVFDRVETRAAENASVSVVDKKHLTWYSMGAALLLVFTTFVTSIGAPLVIYTMAGRVIDNDKMLVPAKTVILNRTNYEVLY